MKGTIIQILILISLINGVNLNAQINLIDNELYCEQYQRIVEYISKDSIAQREFPLKELNFEIDNDVYYGIICPFMTKYYVAEILDVNPDSLHTKDLNVQKLWVETENSEYKESNTKQNSRCLHEIGEKYQIPNVFLRFVRKNERIVSVISSRIYNYPRHTNGIFYLFFFGENNEIRRVYKIPWIE